MEICLSDLLLCWREIVRYEYFIHIQYMEDTIDIYDAFFVDIRNFTLKKLVPELSVSPWVMALRALT